MTTQKKATAEKRIEEIMHFEFERVEIFLLVNGRLPDQKEDILSQEVLDEFCRKFEAGELQENIVPLGYMYFLIKFRKIKSEKI